MVQSRSDGIFIVWCIILYCIILYIILYYILYYIVSSLDQIRSLPSSGHWLSLLLRIMLATLLGRATYIRVLSVINSAFYHPLISEVIS